MKTVFTFFVIPLFLITPLLAQDFDLNSPKSILKDQVNWSVRISEEAVDLARKTDQEIAHYASLLRISDAQQACYYAVILAQSMVDRALFESLKSTCDAEFIIHHLHMKEIVKDEYLRDEIDDIIASIKDLDD